MFFSSLHGDLKMYYDLFIGVQWCPRPGHFTDLTAIQITDYEASSYMCVECPTGLHATFSSMVYSSFF